MRMLSTHLWTVLFTLNPWPWLDASHLRGSYEVAEWFSKLIKTLEEHSHCLTTPLETTKLYENVRNVRCQIGSADIVIAKSEAARLRQAFPPRLYLCPSWRGHLTAHWGTERPFSPHSEWLNLTARADLRPSRPLQQAEKAFGGCESACRCWWLHCQRRHPATSPHTVGSPQSLAPLPPRRAAGRPRSAPPSQSAHGCSPASSFPPAAWCPVFGDQHTLWKSRVEFQNITFFSWKERDIYWEDALSLPILPPKNPMASQRALGPGRAEQCTLRKLDSPSAPRCSTAALSNACNGSMWPECLRKLWQCEGLSETASKRP